MFFFVVAEDWEAGVKKRFAGVPVRSAETHNRRKLNTVLYKGAKGYKYSVIRFFVFMALHIYPFLGHRTALFKDKCWTKS